MTTCKVIDGILHCDCGRTPCPVQTSYQLPKDFKALAGVSVVGEGEGK